MGPVERLESVTKRAEMWYNSERKQAEKQGGSVMLVDRYEPEDVFARVPQAASRLDPVLKVLDALL